MPHCGIFGPQEDDPLRSLGNLIIIGDFVGILIPSVVRANLQNEFVLVIFRKLLHLLLDVLLVFQRKFSFHVILVLRIHVGHIVLHFEERWHWSPAKRTGGTVTQVLSHALDAESVLARQFASIDHDVEAHAAVFF